MNMKARVIHKVYVPYFDPCFKSLVPVVNGCIGLDVVVEIGGVDVGVGEFCFGVGCGAFVVAGGDVVEFVGQILSLIGKDGIPGTNLQLFPGIFLNPKV